VFKYADVDDTIDPDEYLLTAFLGIARFTYNGEANTYDLDDNGQEAQFRELLAKLRPKAMAKEAVEKKPAQKKERQSHYPDSLEVGGAAKQQQRTSCSGRVYT